MEEVLVSLICHSMHQVKHYTRQESGWMSLILSSNTAVLLIHEKFSHDMKLQLNGCSFELLISGKDIEDNVCDLCINWWVVMYIFFCIFFIIDNLFGFWIFCKHCFKYRLPCTRNDVFSFRVNFFSKLNAHPHDSWVGIIKRMNLNVFQYKLLIIPSNQDNHKSLFL